MGFIGENALKPLVKAILKIQNPVGHIRMETTNTNPATYLGFGTWQLWGSGKVPVGVNSNETEFNSVEKTGGSKTKAYTPKGSNTGTALSVSQLPSHNHGAGSYKIAAGSYPLDFNFEGNNNIGINNAENNFTGVRLLYEGKNTPVQHHLDIKIPEKSVSGTSGNTGSGNTHTHTFSGTQENINVIQPYITCYMWKRIA